MLSTLAQIEDDSVAIGDPATFTCNAERRDTDFSISWKVDGRSYTCGASDALDASTDNIHCSMNEDSSELKIENTTSLGVGSYTVECILQHTIPSEFQGDCPTYCTDVTESVTLNVVTETVEPTIVSSSKSNTHMHTLKPNSVLWICCIYGSAFETYSKGGKENCFYERKFSFVLLCSRGLKEGKNGIVDTLAKGRTWFVWPLFH